MSCREKRLIFWIGGLILALAVIATANTRRQNAEAEEPQIAQRKIPYNEEAQDIQLRGRVVCLAEEMHKLYGTDVPANHEHLRGFKAKGGEFYTLLRTTMSAALFVDERLHEKALIITGRTFPKTHLLEAIRLQSIHNGIIHDLYYYCETCAIRAVAPGNCVCCQAPVELVEEPLEFGPLPD